MEGPAGSGATPLRGHGRGPCCQPFGLRVVSKLELSDKRWTRCIIQGRRRAAADDCHEMMFCLPFGSLLGAQRVCLTRRLHAPSSVELFKSQILLGPLLCGTVFSSVCVCVCVCVCAFVKTINLEPSEISSGNFYASKCWYEFENGCIRGTAARGGDSTCLTFYRFYSSY